MSESRHVQLVPQELLPQQKLIGRAESLYATMLARAWSHRSRHRPPIANPTAEQIGYPGTGLPGGQPLPYEPVPGTRPFRP